MCVWLAFCASPLPYLFPAGSGNTSPPSLSDTCLPMWTATLTPHSLTIFALHTYTVRLARPRPGSTLRPIQIRHCSKPGDCLLPSTAPLIFHAWRSQPHSHRLHAFSHDLHPPSTLQQFGVTQISVGGRETIENETIR